MPLRPRPKGDYWWNDAPITDIFEALDLLRPKWGDGFGDETRYVAMDESPPEIHIQWFHDGDSGGASSGVHYLEITQEVVEQLRREGLVEPLMQKGYGWARPDPMRLIISPWGKHRLREYTNETREVARKLLVPGEHSKFSGIFNDAGYGRERSHRGGRLYFDFITPMKEKVRVYPDTKEVKKLEPQRA
jgi:hypothetical protein